MPRIKGATNIRANLLSTEQAAELIGVSIRRIQQFCEEERLGTKVGGTYIITRDEVKAFVKQPRESGNPNFKRAI